MPDFKCRSTALEIMDDLDCSGEVVDQTLRELEFINTWLGGNQVTIGALQLLLKKSESKDSIRIADLGCGGGDMLRLIHRWANKNNIAVELTGIDANVNIVNFAKQNLKDIPQIRLIAMDIFSDEFRSMKFDIVIGTLFYHHFSDEQLGIFFRQLSHQSSLGYILNDIHRHPLAYYSIRLLTRLFSKSAMVKFDAPLSVLRAFKKRELISIFSQAHTSSYSIQWKWAFRWQVVVKTERRA